jgi:hypothetical protein
MDSELEFTQLVRKSGIVFTTNLGQGVEEWVLAIATPTLTKTQVATQADLVAAGFIKVDALKRLEAERDRLMELLKAADEHRQAMNADKQAREAELRALEEAIAKEREVLDARARKGEAWKKAEHEGVIARTKGEPVEACPYDEAGDDVAREGHQAWRHGWRLRDVLLDLNEKGRALQAALVERDAEILGLRAALAAAEGAKAEAEMRAGGADAALAAQRGQVQTLLTRSQKLEETLRTIWAEAPHSPACALWTAAAAEGKASVVSCDCWRARLAGV